MCASRCKHSFVTATVLRSGDEAVRDISGVAVFSSLWSEAAASLQAETDNGDADECVVASQACQDGQPVGVVEVNGDRCCYPGSDDRLITDYHVTMIGYGKKRVSHP